jgi:sulfate permease, SulP family
MRQPKLLTTIKTYSWSLFAQDLLAGATVAMVALPLSLAIAIASGADPAKGLITAIVAGFLISFLGGSRVQIGGPTGAFIVVVFGVIANHGYDGLVLATFMAGIILLVAGYFRAGNLIAFVPEAVVNGFTIGIGIIIATSQLKDFFGLAVDKVPADFLEKIPALWAARETMGLASIAIAVVTLILIVGLRRIAPLVSVRHLLFSCPCPWIPSAPVSGNFQVTCPGRSFPIFRYPGLWNSCLQRS